MTDNDKRWQYLVAGFFEVMHLYNKDGVMIGMVLENDFEVVECYSPQAVANTIDRWINMAQFTGSLH